MHLHRKNRKKVNLVSQTAVLDTASGQTTESTPMYDTVVVDGQTVQVSKNQQVEFVTEDGKTIRVVSRPVAKGTPRTFYRNPGDNPQYFVIVPALAVMEGDKLMHGDRYNGVAYCKENNLLVLLHPAVDTRGNRVIESWATYRSDAASNHHDKVVVSVSVIALDEENAVDAVNG